MTAMSDEVARGRDFVHDIPKLRVEGLCESLGIILKAFSMEIANLTKSYITIIAIKFCIFLINAGSSGSSL